MQQDARSSNPRVNTRTPANRRKLLTLSPAAKVTILALCATGMIVASIYAIVQPLRPDPRQASSWQQFWYPMETNSYSRLPAVNCLDEYACRFNSIFAVG